MDEFYIQLAAIVGAALLAGIAVFQILLFLGFPLGEYSWGGKHKGVLPPLHRRMSVPAAILLCFMGFVLLLRSTLIAGFDVIPTPLLAWIFTIFLGLNTLGNAASKSRNEKRVMTPLSGIAFLMSLLVSVYGS